LHFPPYRIRDKTVENKSGLDPNFIYTSFNFNNYCCQMLSLLSYQAYCFARNIGILFYSILSTKVEKCDFHYKSWNGTKRCHSKAKILIIINIKTLNMCTQEHKKMLNLNNLFYTQFSIRISFACNQHANLCMNIKSIHSS
jgi:hypothetical protein